MTGLLLKIVLLVLVLRAIWRLVQGLAAGMQGAGSIGAREGRSPVALSKDPVCGTYVVPERALPLRDGALVRYFCSERCRDQYARARG